MADPKLVDGRYWTDWFADYVGGAISRREEAAGRLLTAVGWFWTVYTATALFGTALASRTSLSTFEILVILSPIATLSLSYLSALWVLNPIVGHTRQTEQAARELWDVVLRKKLFRLRMASAFLFVSALAIVWAGYLAAHSHGLAVQ